MGWHLDHSAETSAGSVAWGSAGNGPPLIVAHGWPWSSWCWHAVIPELSKHFTTFWYDMPGFGSSMVDPATATGLDIQGGIFGEMVAHWGLEAPDVWAHDFGGAATLRARLLHDCPINKHLLMNVVAMRPWGSAFFEHVGQHIDAFTGLPPHIHAAVVEAYVRGALVRPLSQEHVATLCAPWQNATGQPAFYAQFAQADERFTAEIEPGFKTLGTDVRVLWGTDDPWIPLARGKALADAIGCEIVEMEGMGHLAQLEAPQHTLRHAFDFFLDGSD